MVRWLLPVAAMFWVGLLAFNAASADDTGTGAGGSYAGYCATTPDPAACQQLLNSAINQGLVPPNVGGGGIPFPGQTPGGVNGIVQGPPPSVTVTPPPPASKHADRSERSHLEDIYSQRAQTDLSQFGYDIIGNGSTISALQIGAIQDDYILGQGDAIMVTLRGQENATYNVFVDRDGNVTLPRLRPVSAAGRRFGDFRAELAAAIRQGYLQTQAYITMGQVRQISVNVVGEVANPGVYALSGLSSVLDALNVAGGVRKSGSLRRIVVNRAGQAIDIDLYKFLSADGHAPNVTLRQGDRIVVAPLGATVAVAGQVRRPGIYELPAGVRVATVRSALDLANGYEIRGAYRLTILRTRPDGRQEYADTTGHVGAVLRDGEVLSVSAAVNYASGNITLEGNVRLPGTYAVNRTRTLHTLLPSAQSFLPLTYMPFGFIIRENQQTLKRTVIPFSVQLLIEGKFDEPLQSQDIVHILTFNAMRDLIALRDEETRPVDVQKPECPTAPQDSATSRHRRRHRQSALSNNQCPPSQQALMTNPGAAITPLGGTLGQPSLTLAPGFQPQGGTQTATAGATGAFPSSGTTGTTPAGASGTSTATAGGSAAGGDEDSGVEGLTSDEVDSIGYVVSDYVVTVDGAVRDPGEYLAVPGVPLDEVIDAANGLIPTADLNAVEITSVAIDNVGGVAASTRKTYALTPETLASVSLKRLDVVHIPPVQLDQETGGVEVAGEVQFPGTFHLLRGEHLSSVLQRAGGLTRQAYPLGAIFLRPSVADVRQNAYQREADDLQKQLMASVAQAGNALGASSGQQSGLTAEAAVFVEDVIRQLRTHSADGRMSVVADPAVLAANPQADIELQPGDKLIIPKRPSEVDVTGEVLNPGSFRYSPKLDVGDYIGLSGGYDRYADEDHIFVVNPDGTSRRVADDLFNFAPASLAPGSVIVVPRDLRPLDLGILTVTVTKVLSDLAISAASLAVLSKNN